MGEIVPLNFIFCNGQRNTSTLLYTTEEKQLYKKKSVYKTIVKYVCYMNGCNARISLDSVDGTCSKVKNFVQHNHPTQEQLFESLQFTHTVKEKCLAPESMNNTARKIFNAEAIK